MLDLKLWSVLLSIALITLKLEHVCHARKPATINSLGGFIGCLLDDVCNRIEVCTDDGVFGRCTESSGHVRTNPAVLPFDDDAHVHLSIDPVNEDISYRDYSNSVDDGINWRDLHLQCYLRTIMNQMKTGTSNGDPAILCGIETNSLQSNAFFNPTLPKVSPVHLPDRQPYRENVRDDANYITSSKLNRFKEPLLNDDDDDDDDDDAADGKDDEGFQWRSELFRPTHLHSLWEKSNPKMVSFLLEQIEQLRQGDNKSNMPQRTLEKKTDRTHRRYVPNIPRDALPPKVPVRSWLWTKFIGKSLNAYEAEYFLSELADRLHMSLPITNYHLDQSGNFLSFQVPDASGMSVDNVATSLNQGRGNFDGFQIESVGFGRGVPLLHTKQHVVNPIEKYSTTLIISFSILAFLVLLGFVYVLNHIWCRLRYPRDLEDESKKLKQRPGPHLFATDGLWKRMKSSFEEEVIKTNKKCTTDKRDPESVDQLVACSPNEVRKCTPTNTTTLTGKASESRNKNKIANTAEHNDSVNSQRSSISSWSSETPTFLIDVNTGHMILSYMERFLHDPDLMRTEWETVDKYESEEATPCIDAQKPDNIHKNRPFVSLPYENSRVRLRSSTNDYINASLIYDTKPRNSVYIATPTPMLNTLSDFWQMVWEQCSVVLVSLERANEMKQPEQLNIEATDNDASIQYWPREGGRVYGNFEVHLVSEHSWCEQYTVRSFYLKNIETGETRTVTQFQYMTWEDKSLNKQLNAILELRRKVNRSFRGIVSPIVVNCRDGSGRSGTYILLDIVLNRLAKDIKELNIAASLEHLRDQRPSMVQNQLQYEFVFMAVAQEVDMILNTRNQVG